MVTLNPNAQKWVEALRSGKYKQGRKALTVIENGVEYDCCLGVACKVAIENGLDLETHIESKDEEDATKTLRFYDVKYYGVLPPKVKDWLGLTTEDGVYGVASGIHSGNPCDLLASDNDAGQTFEQIAATIESQPEGLFKIL